MPSYPPDSFRFFDLDFSFGPDDGGSIYFSLNFDEDDPWAAPSEDFTAKLSDNITGSTLRELPVSEYGLSSFSGLPVPSSYAVSIEGSASDYFIYPSSYNDVRTQEHTVRFFADRKSGNVTIQISGVPGFMILDIIQKIYPETHEFIHDTSDLLGF
jgi:hypothetical protein